VREPRRNDENPTPMLLSIPKTVHWLTPLLITDKAELLLKPTHSSASKFSNKNALIIMKRIVRNNINTIEELSSLFLFIHLFRIIKLYRNIKAFYRPLQRLLTE
jgi:hypothetical protein